MYFGLSEGFKFVMIISLSITCKYPSMVAKFWTSESREKLYFVISIFFLDNISFIYEISS